MRKLLFLLCLVPIFADAQNNVPVGGLKDTVRVSGFNATGKVKLGLYANEDSTLFLGIKADGELIPRRPVGTVASLVVTSATTLSLTYATDYVFTGTTSTFTLPVISVSIKGRSNIITIKNRGSGTITVNSASGSTIFGSSLTSTFNISSGEAYTLLPDGSRWNIQ